jgi:hypothetical protein
MTASVLWRLPVPSTALLGTGPTFEIRPKREVVIRFSFEDDRDVQRREVVVFRGVEAFKCTYYHARDPSMRKAYDQLVDRGLSTWLEELSANLRGKGVDVQGLAHLMINFDDGPAYEIVCRSFSVEEQ